MIAVLVLPGPYTVAVDDGKRMWSDVTREANRLNRHGRASLHEFRPRPDLPSGFEPMRFHDFEL